MRVTARAKVNLRLRVLGQERDGFHHIESLFCRIGLADTLDIEAADTLEFGCNDSTIGPPEQNLVWRAAQVFVERSGTSVTSRLHLHKNVPAGAGLGGGSSDAAATLVALNELHGRPLDHAELAALGVRLGSDVPFFLLGVPFALGWGRGERLLPLPAPPATPALIVIPPQRIATAHAYAQLAASRAQSRLEPEVTTLDIDRLCTWEGIAAIARNDFDPIADRLVPDVPAIREALRDAGARIALLSGSGSALFGIFDSVKLRDSAGHAVRRSFPEATVLSTDAAV